MASNPDLDPASRRELLHFIVVGGGPTGVETAAEISDLVAEDLQHLYPEIVQDCVISLFEVFFFCIVIPQTSTSVVRVMACAGGSFRGGFPFLLVCWIFCVVDVLSDGGYDGWGGDSGARSVEFL